MGAAPCLTPLDDHGFALDEGNLLLIGADDVVEAVPERRELGDVAGEDVAAPAVKLLDEAVHREAALLAQWKDPAAAKPRIPIKAAA